jgi:hypothetical protein
MEDGQVGLWVKALLTGQQLDLQGIRLRYITCSTQPRVVTPIGSQREASSAVHPRADAGEEIQLAAWNTARYASGLKHYMHDSSLA